MDNLGRPVNGNGEPVDGRGRVLRRAQKWVVDNSDRVIQALIDETVRRELDEEPSSPAQDEEFVLYHCDNLEASGFVQHLKLPHYVDFQSELGLLRKLRQEFAEANEAPPMQEAAE